MPSSKGGLRRGRARDSRESPPEQKGSCSGWRFRLLIGLAAVAAVAWLGLLLLSSHHLSTDEALRRERHRADELQASVVQLKLELAKRDADVAGLVKRLEAKPSLQPPAGDHQLRGLQGRAAAAAAGRSGEDTELPTSYKKAAPAAMKDAQAPPGGTAGEGSGPSSPAVTCLFKEGLDYVSTGGEEMVEGLDNQKCCELCAAKNRDKLGSCAVAVMSSISDRPPRACWLKSTVSTAQQKDGVWACWPPGHPPIPPDPVDTAKEVRELHGKQLTEMAALASGSPSNEVLRGRAESIRGAMRHAWGAYKRLAWGKDELRPVAGRGVDSLFAHAVTMVDSLDTLWIMGLKEEFTEAKNWLAENLPSRIDRLQGRTSIFETNIRTLGGLLAAYDLSKEKVFLDLATRLGRQISSKTNAAGVTPYTFAGGNGGSRCRSLAESGTMQLEMRYLSHVSGDKSFAEKADHFYDTIRSQKSYHGLWPNCFQNGRGKITFGADGDSFYEYLLKAWHQGGQEEDRLWEMFDAAAEGLEQQLVRKGPDSLTYVGSLTWAGGGSPATYNEEMEHLACFLPGWLALGAMTKRGSSSRSKRMELAANIAYTCWQMYERQPTGIGPERVKGMMMDLSKTDTREYILRPEALEGWWYMLETTQDPRYREWGWKTFLAFQNNLWVPNGFASLKDVRDKGRGYIDRMESFFLAETMKYLFLLQDPDHSIKLDRYVLNTEGHPLSVIKGAAS